MTRKLIFRTIGILSALFWMMTVNAQLWEELPVSVTVQKGDSVPVYQLVGKFGFNPDQILWDDCTLLAKEKEVIIAKEKGNCMIPYAIDDQLFAVIDLTVEGDIEKPHISESFEVNPNEFTSVEELIAKSGAIEFKFYDPDKALVWKGDGFEMGTTGKASVFGYDIDGDAVLELNILCINSVPPVEFSTDFIELMPGESISLKVISHLRCCIGKIVKVGVSEENVANAEIVSEDEIVITATSIGSTTLTATVLVNDTEYTLDAEITVIDYWLPDVYLSADPVKVDLNKQTEVYVNSTLECMDCQPTDIMAYITADGVWNKTYPAKVVSVEDNKIVIEGVIPGKAILVVEGLVVGREFHIEATVEVSEPIVGGVSLSTDFVELEIGEQAEVFVTVPFLCENCQPTDFKAYIVNDIVDTGFQSAKVVEIIDNKIVIEGILPGNSTLIVEGYYNDAFFSLKAQIQVNKGMPYEAAYLNATEVDLMAGEKFTFEVISNIKCFDKCEIAIEEVKTDNPEVAGVYNVWNNQIFVEAVEAGETILTVVGSVAGYSFVLDAIITVHPDHFTDTLYFELEPKEMYLEIGDTDYFKFIYGGEFPIMPRYGAWSSSDASVAIVDQNGAVTAVGAGKAEISITFQEGDIVSIYRGTVIVKNGTGLIHTATIPVGHKIAIDKAFPAIDSDCTFQVNTAGIISLDREFNIYGLRAGTVDLTAYNIWGDKIATCRVYVEDYGIVYEKVKIRGVQCIDDYLVNIDFATPVTLDDKVEITVEIIKIRFKSGADAGVKSVYLSNNGTTMVVELDRKLESDESVEVTVKDGLLSETGDELSFTVSAKGQKEEVLSIAGETVEVKTYPNPAINTLSIETSLELNAVTVYNELGNIVKSLSATGSAVSIEVADLPQGVYTLNLSSEDGTSTSRQFIKQ